MTSTLYRPARTAGVTLPDLTGLVRAVAADRRLWEDKLQIPDGTERWWTRLSTDRRVDVWLLSWLPGHATDLHDHGHSAAAFSVVRGELLEVRAEPNGRRTTFRRRPESVTWLAPGVIHDVHGAGAGPAVSIHAYSPPLTTMNYYAPAANGALAVARTVQTHEPEEELQR
jgi:predicted metal-dependent enzyme (double-stranded beta helix superfamily)